MARRMRSIWKIKENNRRGISNHDSVDIEIGLVVAGMADVEGAVACVVTGIKREGLRCVVFWS